MASRVDSAGNVYQLDRLAEPDELVSDEDVADRSKLSRLLIRILKDVATIKRRFMPRRTDFEGLVVDGTATTKYRLHHGFNARVRWWVVGVHDATNEADLRQHSDTNLNTLVLVSNADNVVDVRVEVAG